MRALILTISLFVVLASISACKRYNYPSTENISASAAEVAEGQKLYMTYCQKCHPFGDAGLGPSIFYLPSLPKRIQTRVGLGVMPNFGDHVISHEDLKKIMKYMKALK